MAPFTAAPFRDEEAEAVRNAPATPDEAPHKPGWGIWDERNADTLEQRRRRYLDSEMCECSDDEHWRSIRYGPPCADSPDEESEESSISNDTMLRCSNLSPELRQMMLENNQLLRARVSRLDYEWEEVQLRNDTLAMGSLEDQIREAH